MKKGCLLVIVILLLLFLNGCNSSQQSQALEEIFAIYESIAEIEKEIAIHEQQKAELEQQEDELSQYIIEHGKANNQDVQQQLEEILASITTRQRLVEEQIGLMQESQEKLQDIEELMVQIDDLEIKAKVARVQTLYQERYDAFMEFIADYQQITQQEMQIYTELQEDTQNLRELGEQILQLNEAYVHNEELRKTLMELSNQLNEAKRVLYLY